MSFDDLTLSPKFESVKYSGMKNENLLNKQYVLFANRIVFKKLLISLTLVVNIINYLIG